MHNAVMPTYGRYPISLVRGDGAWVWDDKGRQYLDFVSGIAVNSLGHAHPRLLESLSEQMGQMLHCSNLYHIPLQQQLAHRLAQLSGLDQVFFCNSGAEANEAAIKLARKYFADQNKPRYRIISAEQSFHGRTLATLTATGQAKVKTGFSPLPAGFLSVPLNDIEALEQSIDAHTAAILLEPIQAEGGVHAVDQDYIQAVRSLCDQHGLLLILDEVQTGIGRTGQMFAYQSLSIKPDILCLAKGLAGGVPIGAMLASLAVAKSFSAGTHGSTFGGNPLSCRAALTVLEVIEEDGLLQHVQEQGARLSAGLQRLCQSYEGLLSVRGRGLLCGLLCDRPVADFVQACADEGLLVLPAGERVLRLLPALNITHAEIDRALLLLEKAWQKVCL